MDFFGSKELRREAPPTRYEQLKKVVKKKWASLSGKTKRKALKDVADEARREHKRELDALAEQEDESKQTGAMAVFVKKGPRIHVGKHNDQQCPLRLQSPKRIIS